MVTDAIDPTLTVMYGSGDGSLAASGIDISAGSQSVAVGDLDGDHHPDIVVAERSTHTLAVLMGNGTRTPTRRPDTSLGTAAPIAVALADVNGDGVLDAVIGDNQTFSVVVLLGAGDGTFGAPHGYPIGSRPSSIAVGALVLGAKPDIVVTCDALGKLIVLRNQGDGTFLQQARSYTTGDMPTSAVIADVTGDGVPDVLVANHTGATISVLAGNGDGTLHDRVDYGTGILPNSFAVADVTGDGAPDLIVPSGNTTLRVLPAACLP